MKLVANGHKVVQLAEHLTHDHLAIPDNHMNRSMSSGSTAKDGNIITHQSRTTETYMNYLHKRFQI